MTKANDKHALKHYMLLVVLGFSFSLSFNGPSIGSLASTYLPEPSSFTVQFSFRIAQAIAFALLAIFSNRQKPLHENLVFPVTSAIVALVCSLSASLLLLLGEASIEVSILCGVLFAAIGAASAVLYLMWIELICYAGISKALTCFSGAYLLSGITVLLLSFLPRTIDVIISSLLPALIILIYLNSSQKKPCDDEMEGIKPLPGWSFPYRPVILMAVLACANSFIGGFVGSDSKLYSSMGAILVTGVVLCIALRKGGRFDTQTLWKVTLPLITAAALCLILEAPSLRTVSSVLSNGAFVMFIIFISVTLCSMSYRFGINPLWLFGFVFSARTLTSSLTVWLKDWLSPWIFTPFGESVVLAVIVLALTILFPFSLDMKGIGGTWGLHLTTKPEADTTQEPFQDLLMNSMIVARNYGLTPREEEILFYLAQDYTLARIGDQLCLATATVKTHTQHIYKKLDVHSKQELIELLA